MMVFGWLTDVVTLPRSVENSSRRILGQIARASLVTVESDCGKSLHKHSLSRYVKVFGYCLLLIIGLTSFSGCRSIDQQKRQIESPLAVLEKTPTQIELEVIFVRIPPRDQEATAALWQEVDELAIDAKFRRELRKNGFRVGIIGTQIPKEVQTILQNAHRAGTGNISLEELGDLQSTHAITRKLFLQPGQQSELLASSIQKEFQMLEMHDGALVGQTLHDGQAQFVAEILDGQDERIVLRLTPEVHFGEFHNEYVPGEGMFRLNTSRDKKRLGRLQLDANLDQGQILIVGPQADQPGSLGHRFFNEQATAKSISKLMMIRICDIAIASTTDATDAEVLKKNND